MKILITGGNGYVGRELVRLLYHEHEICVLDNLRYGAVRFAPHELAQLRLAEVDLRDACAVKTLVADFAPAIIVHLAAIHFIPECENDPLTAVNTNVVGTLNLLAAAPANCRFVFASSGAVYQPETVPHREDHSPLQPSDIYGLTKLQGEQYVEQFAAKRDFAAVIIRLFNVVGAGETNPHVLPEIVAQLKAGYQVLKLGNLTPKRDYIGVEDAARGFKAAALQGEIDPGTTIKANLGTQQAYSVEQLLTLLRTVAAVDFKVETDPTRLRKVDRPYLAADRTRMATLFGWEPQQALETILHAMWLEPDLPAALVKRYQSANPDRCACQIKSC